MTPEQRKHSAQADLLQIEAAKKIDSTKSGHSGAAAKTILEANIERKKAGLIKGELKR